MRRLRPRESVTINLDSVDGQIDCFVRSVTGAVATLGRFGGLEPRLRLAMSPGLLGYLTFTYDGQAVALRGVATVDCAPPPDLAFVALDGIKLPERRSDVRIPLATTARVCTVDDYGNAAGEPVDTITSDLSLGGMLVERRQRMGIGPLVAATILFGPGQPAVQCEAKVARLTTTHMGLKFSEMSEADRVRLSGVLSEHERRVGRQGTGDTAAA